MVPQYAKNWPVMVRFWRSIGGMLSPNHWYTKKSDRAGPSSNWCITNSEKTPQMIIPASIPAPPLITCQRSSSKWSKKPISGPPSRAESSVGTGRASPCVLIWRFLERDKSRSISIGYRKQPRSLLRGAQKNDVTYAFFKRKKTPTVWRCSFSGDCSCDWGRDVVWFYKKSPNSNTEKGHSASVCGGFKPVQTWPQIS